MRRLCTRVNEPVELSVDLNLNGVVAGRVVLTGILRPATKDELLETIPENEITINEALFSIKKIEVKNLIGGDAGFMQGGKQDPFVVISIDKWSARTPHKEEAGANAIWDPVSGMDTTLTGLLYFKF